ncbi:MAG: hypothetical protein WBL21_00115 [Salinimicrobium sp.]
MTETIWATLTDVRYKGFCLTYLMEKYKRRERNINLFLALISYGGILGWILNQHLPLLWASVIGVAQLFTIAEPYFPYNKYVEELNEKIPKIDFLVIELEELWRKSENNSVDPQEVEARYYELRRRLQDPLTYSKDAIFNFTKKIKNKALGKMETYLLVTFGVSYKFKKV